VGPSIPQKFSKTKPWHPLGYPGIYSWSWGSGLDADDLTLHVEETIPPVPGPLPLLGASAAFVWSRHLRKRCLQARR
jgi:hypothetical protein